MIKTFCCPITNLTTIVCSAVCFKTQPQSTTATVFFLFACYLHWIKNGCLFICTVVRVRLYTLKRLKLQNLTQSGKKHNIVVTNFLFV